MYLKVECLTKTISLLTKMYGLQSFGGRRRISRCPLAAAIKSNGSAQVIANVRCHTSSNYMMSSTALQSFDIACEYLFIHKTICVSVKLYSTSHQEICLCEHIVTKAMQGIEEMMEK